MDDDDSTINKDDQESKCLSDKTITNATRPDVIEQSQPKEEATLLDDTDKVNPSTENIFSSTACKTFVASSDELQRRVQEKIDSINVKRKRDTDLLNGFRKGFEMHVSRACAAIEGTIVKTYEERSHIIENKLQEIFAALERIRQLEEELKNFKSTLGLLYTDLQNSQ